MGDYIMRKMHAKKKINNIIFMKAKKIALEETKRMFKFPQFIVGEAQNELNINCFGHYRAGLTSAEIDEYLHRRTGKKRVKQLRQKFNKASGVNTCAIGPNGQPLMYRHDVKRFADVILLGIPTYFD